MIIFYYSIAAYAPRRHSGIFAFRMLDTLRRYKGVLEGKAKPVCGKAPAGNKPNAWTRISGRIP